MRLLRAVLFSLGVHFTILWCLSLIPETLTVMPESAIDHYVEFVDNPKPRGETKGTVVRKQELPRELLAPDREVKKRYLSEERQTVLEETRAAESGLTKNRSQTLPSPNRLGALIAKEIRNGKKKSFETYEEGVEVGEQSGGDGNGEARSQDLAFPNMRQFGLDAGRSTFGDSADSNLKIGEMTALNTDRFLYYSFYERAQDLVYHHWEKYVKAVLYSYQRSGAATGDEFWVTRVEIVLDKNGNFLKGLIHQGSGLQGLDLAPVHAFRDAQAVPNPPIEMVQADGTIHMDWEFEVKVQSRLANTN